MLTGIEILRNIENGDIVITPFDKKQLNPNSYNLKLHNELKVYDVKNNVHDSKSIITQDDLMDEEVIATNGITIGINGEYQTIQCSAIDSRKVNKTKTIEIPEHGLLLVPGVLYLGMTQEYTETNEFIPCISGRSSIGRLGINIHATAGFGDIGFKGTWTLEIFVVQPVWIYPDMEIAQIYYFKPDGCTDITYNGKYQNSRDIGASKLFKELNG